MCKRAFESNQTCHGTEFRAALMENQTQSKLVFDMNCSLRHDDIANNEHRLRAQKYFYFYFQNNNFVLLHFVHRNLENVH